MVFTSNSLSDVIVYNSITNTISDQKFDNVKPFSFIEFLNYSKSLDRKIIEFADYQSSDIFYLSHNHLSSLHYSLKKLPFQSSSGIPFFSSHTNLWPWVRLIVIIDRFFYIAIERLLMF